MNFTEDGTNIYDLQFILFCHECERNSTIIKWGSAYYKKLRVWDGNMVNENILPEFDQYFDSFSSSRLNGIQYFYPLFSKYIINNKIYDPAKANGIEITSLPIGTDYVLQLINFSSNFDIVKVIFPSLGFHFEDLSNVKGCSTGCTRCWDFDKNSCYETDKDQFKITPDLINDIIIDSNFCFGIVNNTNTLEKQLLEEK